MANETINATDSVNTINYQLGDGVDSVGFALPRTYQYAEFLTAAEQGLQELSTSKASGYTNSYFATANQSLLDALPYDISSTLSGMHQQYVWGTGYVPGTVDPDAARAAFTALIDWINTPVSNVIQFGPGIKLSDIALQVGATADFGTPHSTPVQFAVAVNNEAGIVFGLTGTQAVAGDTSAPPVINMQFQFDDGSTASLADLLALPNQGVMGTQLGTEGSDFLHGSLGDDTLMGGDGNDKLDGGAGADQLFGGSGDDVISGGSGNDIIYGEDGNDVMAAGARGGFMSGGAGDDVYSFNRGDGSVTIDNQDWDGSGVDTISFGKDVAPSDLVASVDPSTGNLTLGILGTDASITDTITIPWFDPWSGMASRIDETIDRVQFFDADGAAKVYDLASLVGAAFSDPSVADPSVAVSLMTLASGEVSSLAAGGDAAHSYALTGTLFTDEAQPTPTPSDPVPPVDSAPSDPSTPSDPTPPVDSAPSDPSSPSDPVPPVDSAPSDPSTPSDPTPPVDSAPSDPSTPSDPVPPVDSAPSDPSTPSDPTPPVDSAPSDPSPPPVDSTQNDPVPTEPTSPGPAPEPGRTIRGTRHNDRLYGTSGDDDISGAKGNDRLSGRDGDDVLRGGAGNDHLNGGKGVDLLQGGSGNDRLSDTSGNSLLDGGAGNDVLIDGSGNSLLVGGKGRDHLYLGGGYDVIAFNRGDGRDVVSSGRGSTSTLSLGGGIRYEDLSLRRSGNDLILDVGGHERITLEKWYKGQKYQAITTLQVVSEGTGLDPAHIDTYDFKSLVNAFDTARHGNHGTSSWALTNAMTQFHLSSSDAVLGGDLAYQYGVDGTLAGIGVAAARDNVGSNQFGKQAQPVHSDSKLREGLVKLS
ncbi:MAG TPA: hypothetical protein VEK05_12820 [Burkholderiales bacterium]|nr:hypothetical protein [Burkholderiales bacterium]